MIPAINTTLNPRPTVVLAALGRIWWQEVLLRRSYVRSADPSQPDLFHMFMDRFYDFDSNTEWTRVVHGFMGIVRDVESDSWAAGHKFGVHGPPAYVYYDIESMEADVAPLFQEHLHKQMTGLNEQYVRQYYTRSDHERIDYWNQTLMGIIGNAQLEI